MLEIQKWLRRGFSLEKLEADYHVKAKRHGEHPNLVLLKYDQVESPMADPMVQECRGIILDEANNWALISMGYKKFFNYGEGNAAAIDWSTATVQEKVDGSLCVLYFYKGKAHVATTGMPDASEPVGRLGMTFADLFWKTFAAEGYSRELFELYCRERLADGMGWLHNIRFELCAPENKVVVPHVTAKLYYLGTRMVAINPLIDVQTSEIECILVARLLQGRDAVVRQPKRYSLNNFTDIQATFDQMNPLAQEGYVVVDAQFNRVKVKHPGYVALSHMKDANSGKSMLEVIRKGEASEYQATFIASFPEFGEEFTKLLNQFEDYASAADIMFVRFNQPMPDSNGLLQEEFAARVSGQKASNYFFQRRAGKVQSFKEWAKDVRIELLKEIMGVA